jgi:enoyl-CoA hydratase
MAEVDDAEVDDAEVDDIVLVDVADNVAVVTLNRPARRNALNAALYRRIPEVLRGLDRDDAVAVTILTGADPAFCAGVDLKEFGDSSRAPAVPAEPAGGRTSWRGFLPALVKPVIGAINGPCITGGLELALSCDFLVASERARFADTHAMVGVMPGDGLIVRLPEAVGVRRAKEMSLTGNLVDAPTALAWGLVNHVVAHAELLPFCHELATAVAANDQSGVRRMLATYNEVGATHDDGAWEIEDRVSRAWEGSGYDPAEIARRRTGIIERGRRQAST